ncbi:MAG: hypothetical protein M1814_006588 [Vezdaea aestivalis]|nr:MAG: hypothetical protein M1814_006588 [Vezdaea aestivalis]
MLSLFSSYALALLCTSALAAPPLGNWNATTITTSLQSITQVPSLITTPTGTRTAPRTTASADPNFDALRDRFNATNGTLPSATPKGPGEEYVVMFDPEHPTPLEISEFLAKAGMNHSSDINYVFDNSQFRGFAGNMPGERVEALNAMKEVKFVEESVKISSFGPARRVNSPWGLQRLSSQGRVSGDASTVSFTYNFDSDGSLGAGVDIYILDTGVNTAHAAFGGRARMGFSKDGPNDLNANCDQDGHGTHVAGTAAGSVFGVASGANVIGVKVLGSDGSGLSSDTIKGLDYVIRQHDANKKKGNFIGSIASMSWGLEGRSASVEQAINAAIDAGVHVSIASGNQGRDACGGTPAALGGKGANGKGARAVSVGSINTQDQISTFSNTGQCVDVYAPGEGIISTWIGGTNTVKALTGTSMACPHVTGLMAYLMARDSKLAGCTSCMKSYLSSTSFSLQNSRKAGDAGLLVNNGMTGLGKRNLRGTSWTSPSFDRVVKRW